MLTFMMLRAQKPFQMTAGGVVRLSVRNFGKVRIMLYGTRRKWINIYEYKN